METGNTVLFNCLFICIPLSGKSAGTGTTSETYKGNCRSLTKSEFWNILLCDGSGTTVIIDPNGARSSTGNIILISSNFSAALFYVEAIPGTKITILPEPVAILSSSNGATMQLEIGDGNIYPRSPFTSTGTNAISIGGVLNVGTKSANPPGDYSGTFTVTFIQE